MNNKLHPIVQLVVGIVIALVVLGIVWYMGLLSGP